jgi:hypothetical protein
MVNGGPFVTISTAHGPVTITAAQARALAECVGLMRDAGKRPVWHRNACECCVSVHDADDTTGGYVIGADGRYGWVDA